MNLLTVMLQGYISASKNFFGPTQKIFKVFLEKSVVPHLTLRLNWSDKCTKKEVFHEGFLFTVFPEEILNAKLMHFFYHIYINIKRIEEMCKRVEMI